MRILLPAVAALGLFLAPTQADDVVTPWSQALRQHLQATQVTNSESSRQLAMLHLSQYLAVQDVLRARNIPLNDAAARMNPDIQPELTAAVAGAGKAVLDRLAPPAGAATQQLFNAQTQMNNVTVERLRGVRDRAATIGQQVVDTRANDGSALPPPLFQGFTEPGKWRPTPPDFRAAVETQWGQVTPFFLDRAALPNQYRIPAPPALDSPPYFHSYYEIKELGRRASTVRNQDQTQKAEYWSANPQLIWFQALDEITANPMNRLGGQMNRMGVADAAKAYAMASVAAADSRISLFENKYTYNHWRPITSIRAGNGPANFEVQQDWEPAQVTPAAPEYPSGHSVLGGTY